MSLDDFVILGPLCYQGKADCDSPRCRRMVFRNDDGTFSTGPCLGYHCSYCDAPCGMMGHNCDAADAILGESRRALDERETA